LDTGGLDMMNHATVLQIAETSHITDLGPPSDDTSRRHDEGLEILSIYLNTLAFPTDIPTTQCLCILKQAP
jgi:hypothetical protein